MNELLDELKPIVPTTENRHLAMIEHFKNFFLSYDMVQLNDYSLHYFHDYADYYFSSFPYPVVARHLQVMGSFIGWLGSNCGRVFLNEAKRLGELNQSLHKGYIYAWASENERITGVNDGTTVLEYLLTPAEKHDTEYGLNCPCNHFVSSHDIETVNHLIHWLATSHGQSFLTPAYEHVSKLIQENRNKHFENSSA